MPIHDWTRVPDSVFHSFHGGWITALADALNEGVLPDGFYAAGEKQMPGVEPDVLTFVRGPAGKGGGNAAPAATGPGVVSVLNRPPAVAVVERMAVTDGATTIRQDSVAVRRSGDDRMVAVVELVSAGNKSSRTRTDAFLGKLVGLVGAGVHVLIVDLYPPTTTAPRGLHAAAWARLTGQEATAPTNGATNGAAAADLVQASYLADSPPRAFVQPTRVGGDLARMPLFLTTENYVEVPLAETYAERFRKFPRPWREDLTG